MINTKHTATYLTLCLGLTAGPAISAEAQLPEGEDVIHVQRTAEEELKQQPGVSIITEEDIRKQPPVNDLSEIIRKMPGVNLTGNSASGSRGNNRQIDIRGMGPENTLILIDGKPVTSRNAVRYDWRGERDTRGDSNWVPVEEVERIEVIRGPAAARYGSGAAGGVVNIITKRPTNDWHGSLGLYTNQPEDSKEGDTKRANFNLSGPLAGEALTMRLYGNINKTDADSWDINAVENGATAAGREGVRNKDINALLSWKPTDTQVLDFEYGYSRQGNIYTGDTQTGSISDTTQALAQSGAETNRMYRQNWGLTHNGIWDWGQTRLGAYYEKTNNTRYNEGLTGSVQGQITGAQEFKTSRLENFRLNAETNIPFHAGVDHLVTLGAEWNKEKLDDPQATSYNATDPDLGEITGIPASAAERSSKNNAEISALYFEDNIQAFDGTNIIPGVRVDYHDKFGSNFSPSLNLSQEVGDYFKIKAGIARAFKAPNLYQSSEGYLLTTRGNGCPVDLATGRCYLLGNDNLDPEVSINKEIGIEFANNGYHAGVTWFRNDYRNKIVSGTELIGQTATGANILRWENGGKAVIEGLEASFTVPVIEDSLSWRTNGTWMFTSEMKDTGNPLSIIPEYTVNTLLDWQITDSFSTSLSWTMYGRQKPREYAESRSEGSTGLSGREVGSYSVVGVGANYIVNKHLRLNAGISNVFDKKLYRADDGASTYNEPGRAFYAGVTTSF